MTTPSGGIGRPAADAPLEVPNLVDTFRTSPTDATSVDGRGPVAATGPAGADGESLLRAATDGDGEAIAALYRDHQPRLLRILRAEVGDAADDVASQTWLEVVRGLSRFRGDLDGFRALLFTVARRRVADHRRTRRRRPASPTAPEDLVEVAASGPDASALALAGLDAEQAVAWILEVLTPEQADVVLLRVVADLPVEHVAAVLGRSAGTVRVQQHRALKRLAASLDGNGGHRPGDRTER